MKQNACFLFLNCKFSLCSNWQKLKKYVINETVCLPSNFNVFEQYFTCSLNISYIYQYILICPSSSSQVPYLHPTTFLTSCLPFWLLLLLTNPWVQSVLPLYAWCGAIHWSVSNLSLAIVSKEKRLSLLSNHQLPIAPQTRLWLGAPPHSLWNSNWLDLVCVSCR